MDKPKLHYETVTPSLRRALDKIMAEPLFTPFRLVGGTNLSLRYGHRLSVDIDLFTDAEYKSLDFGIFEEWLKKNFKYYECSDDSSIVGFGRSYYVGDSADEIIKLDLMYADPFLAEPETIDGIRMAAVEDIIAMKMDVVSRGGRKKDFWDLHHLLKDFSVDEMIALHGKRYEWTHNPEELFENLTLFTEADKSEDPVCLLGKDWDNIKLDFIELTER